MIAALYVESDGAYFGLADVEPWDEAKDARRYTGHAPVVAHPSTVSRSADWHRADGTKGTLMTQPTDQSSREQEREVPRPAKAKGWSALDLHAAQCYEDAQRFAPRLPDPPTVSAPTAGQLQLSALWELQARVGDAHENHGRNDERTMKAREVFYEALRAALAAPPQPLSTEAVYVVRDSEGCAIDVHDREPDMTAYHAACTLHVYPTVSAEAGKVEWIDDHGGRHAVTIPYAAELLKQLFDEWPDGVNEIEAALRWRDREIARLTSEPVAVSGEVSERVAKCSAILTLIDNYAPEKLGTAERTHLAVAVDAVLALAGSGGKKAAALERMARLDDEIGDTP